MSKGEPAAVAMDYKPKSRGSVTLYDEDVKDFPSVKPGSEMTITMVIKVSSMSSSKDKYGKNVETRSSIDGDIVDVKFKKGNVFSAMADDDEDD